MAQAGTQVCLVIAIVLSVCVHVRVCVFLCIYMWLSVFIELLPGKTRGGAQCTQDTGAN